MLLVNYNARPMSLENWRQGQIRNGNLDAGAEANRLLARFGDIRLPDETEENLSPALMALENPNHLPLGHFLKLRRSEIAPRPEERFSRRHRSTGLNQYQVASRMDVTPSVYAHLEQGKNPSLNSLFRAAVALELTQHQTFLLLRRYGPIPNLPTR